MDFLDDEAGVSDEDDILVPSSQGKENVRPTKRRRLNKHYQGKSSSESSSESDEYDLPSNDYDEYDEAEEEDLDKPKSKYESRMHIPQYVEPHQDTFVTQLSQPWSSPSRIRGPRWKKPLPPPPPPPALSTTTHTPPRNFQSRSINDHQQSIYPQPNPPSIPQSLPQTDVPISVTEFDEDEPALLEALLSSPPNVSEQITNDDLRTSFTSNASNTFRPLGQQSSNLRQATLFGNATSQTHQRSTQSKVHNWPLANREEAPTHHKIDIEAMKTWVYPINLGKIRDYQFNIVHKALFNNLLVALPTGLGKTFIAATVMLNWFRWTKDAQMVFVAPTKPLVSQQIDACFNIVGIPRSQTTMLTGEVAPAVRAEDWQEKRVFFMTPQTLINDLKNGMCDPKKLVLLVVDEAHKATGNYAYVEVVRFLRRFNSSFRVLALTATPGASVEAVQKVIDGLDIARVEIRTEDSLDIREFVHSRNIDLKVFDNTDEISMALELFASAVRPLMNRLNTQNAYWGKDPTMISLYGLKVARDQWTKSQAGRAADWGLKGMVNGIFNVLMSLAHNLELLKYHGIGPFYHKMRIFENEAAGNGKYAKQIIEDEHFRKLMNRLSAWVNNVDFEGHPKLTYLKEIVLNHFMDAGEGQGTAGGRPPSDTRIMIFAHYRDSAEEIVRVLNRHGPMIRAHVFVGQSGTKGSEGMDQKMQMDIIKKFKAGTYNTIVATSIGEEGLDIGEVDLIVCYDCSKSPIRMLQRMGRTGRKRAGNIVLLLMRGKEEDDYYKAKDNYLKMQSIIESGRDFLYHEDVSPRIVPREIVPVVDKRVVDIPTENTQAVALEPSKRRPKNAKAKKPPKKFNMPDGVETGFSFLGPGKKKKAPSPSPEPEMDIEDASLPPLDTVLLTSREQQQLQERYAQVSGNEPQYIRQIRMGAFPAAQRRLTKTSLVKHSKMTKLMVKAINTMRTAGKDWTRPADDKANQVDDPALESELDAHRKTCRQRTTRPGGQNFEAGSEDEYDSMDSFIDNEPMQKHAISSSPEEEEQVQNQKVTETRRQYEPFYTSQKSMGDSDNIDSSLPGIDDLVPEKSTRNNSRPVSNQRRHARRIMDSDDD